MSTLLEQLAAELSFVRADELVGDWNQTLHYCRTDLTVPSETYEPTESDDLLYDIIMKGLQRGRRPFPSYFAEQRIVRLYGEPFAIAEKKKSKRGAIEYRYNKSLLRRYREFSDVVDPWQGQSEDVVFDRDHPENERLLFNRLARRESCANGDIMGTRYLKNSVSSATLAYVNRSTCVGCAAKQSGCCADGMGTSVGHRHQRPRHEIGCLCLENYRGTTDAHGWGTRNIRAHSRFNF